MLLVGALAVAACGGDDGGAESSGDDAADDAGEADDGTGETTMSPEEVVEAYRLAYNADEIDGVMALFSEESILVDHPTALFGGVGDGGNTLTGLDEIRQANAQDRTSAADGGAYEFLDVEVSGDTITWDHTWEGVNGAEWCGEGHNAVIVDRVFVTWNYAQDTHPCSPDCTFADVFQEPLPDVCRRS